MIFVSRLLIFAMLLSCVAQTPTRGDKSDLLKNCDENGENCSIGGGGGIGGDDDDEPVAKVEIRHLIDPFTGTYQRKLTIPKNYRGQLYLSGLNLQSIRDKHIYVRFKFGMAKEEITYEATLGRGQGITPATNIDVLIIDLSELSNEGRRFEDIRLIYDLFDYNEYDLASGDEPTTDNLDINLFCRGLYLQDDPTFQGTGGSCAANDSECRYAYAKVLDKGYMKDDGVGNYYPIVDLLQNIDFSGRGYEYDDFDKQIRKCLPDRYPNMNGTYPGDAGNNCSGNQSCVPAYDSSTGLVTYYGIDEGIGSLTSINGTNYWFNGAFRSLNQGLWQLSGDAIFGTYGLFEGPSGDVDAGYGSKLFPLASKLDLSSSTQHMSHSSYSTSSVASVVTSFPTSGDTALMDGCNARVSTKNPNTNEHIGSCNVAAEIQILEKDAQTGLFKVIAGYSEGGKEVKLQLTRDSQTNVSGNEVLASALNQCSNSNACGSNECCFNNRCWSKEIVSLCPESAPSSGNEGIGENCASDFDCSSLCCSPTSGRCEVHNNSLEPAVLCSKPPGQVCIAKEWCMKQVVNDCRIVKTGFDQFGTVTCEVRCYNVEKFGDCVSGICTPPLGLDAPVFNPSDPNACDGAIDPPY